MKNINIKVLSLLVAMTGFFASCSQEELVKADFDKENAVNPTNVPTIVAIDSVSAAGFSAVVDVTIKGDFENILELAIVFADNDTLGNAGYSFVYTKDLLSQVPDTVVVDKEAGYTFRVPVTGLSQDTHYYMSAYMYVRNNPIAEYTGELLQLTTEKVYDFFSNGAFTAPMFGGTWGAIMEKHKYEENTYRLADYIMPGYDLVFTWDQETNEVNFANPTWEIGYIHPNYGMMSNNGVAAEYDAESKTFTFVVEYIVAAGSFGTVVDTFTMIE